MTIRTFKPAKSVIITGLALAGIITAGGAAASLSPGGIELAAGPVVITIGGPQGGVQAGLRSDPNANIRITLPGTARNFYK